MRGVWIEIDRFLDLTLDVTVKEQQYSGIALLVDRIAEIPPNGASLLGGLDHALSISDVTGNDILILVPHPSQDPDVFSHTTYHTQPKEEGFSGFGILTPNARPDWIEQMWKEGRKTVDETEIKQMQTAQLNNLSREEVKESLQAQITASASRLRKYLGLSENDIPCLVILCLANSRAIVLRWAKLDGTPYAFFKKVMQRSPGGWGPWLSEAVKDVAKDSDRKQGEPLTLKPEVLKDWEAIRYLPRGVNPIASATHAK